MLIFLKITDVDDFKQWLKTLTPFIATAEEVLAFNRLFKALRRRRGETNTVKATWINIAFSFSALERLSSDADDFTDNGFRAGLAAQSQSLGDPADSAAEGNKATWFVGGPDNEADVVLIVASDDRDDLFDEVARIEDTVFFSRLGYSNRRRLLLLAVHQGFEATCQLSFSWNEDGTRCLFFIPTTRSWKPKKNTSTC